MSPPRIYALHGDTFAHVPDTPPALSAALDQGADGLAIDVDGSLDGVAIVCGPEVVRPGLHPLPLRAILAAYPVDIVLLTRS